LEGGCQVPIGVHSSLSADGTLTLAGTVMSPDGDVCIQDEVSCVVTDKSPEALGQELGARVLASGAAAILPPGKRPITYSTAQEKE